MADRVLAVLVNGNIEALPDGDSITGSGGSIGGIMLDSSPPSNTEVSGIVSTETVDVNSVGFGAVLYRSSDFHLETANAASDDTMPVVALALETGTGSKKVLRRGYVRYDSWSWSAGNIYASTTTGGLTQTPPNGDIVQLIGEAVSATVIYFCPQVTSSSSVVTQITSADSPYTPVKSGEIIECDSTDGEIVIATSSVSDPSNWVVSVVVTEYVNSVTIDSPAISLNFVGDGRSLYHNGTEWKNKTF